MKAIDKEVLAALLGAVVGAVATAGATWLLNDQTIDAQKDQETREKRANVYLDFHTASHTWVDTRIKQVNCNCVPSQQIVDVSNAFRDEIMQVRIFGSPEASNAAIAVGQAIPDTWPGLGGPIQVDPNKQFDLNAYAAAEGKFVQLMCKELPARSNQQCG